MGPPSARYLYYIKSHCHLQEDFHIFPHFCDSDFISLKGTPIGRTTHGQLGFPSFQQHSPTTDSNFGTFLCRCFDVVPYFSPSFFFFLKFVLGLLSDY